MTHTPEDIIDTDPRKVAFDLITTTALDYAAYNSPVYGPEEPNWEMHGRLTATLNHWDTAGTLAENSLLLTEQLAAELVAYLMYQLKEHTSVKTWLCDFGDQVCKAQKHEHPAGPTAVQILSSVANDMNRNASNANRAQQLAEVGAPYLLYLRDDHKIQDAREIVLTFALWTGSQLSSLMQDNRSRIAAYMSARGF